MKIAIILMAVVFAVAVKSSAGDRSMQDLVVAITGILAALGILILSYSKGIYEGRFSVVMCVPFLSISFALLARYAGLLKLENTLIVFIFSVISVICLGIDQYSRGGGSR